MNHQLHRTHGFSLIEMIGVLSIMAILAAVILPNGVRALDRAAVRAEAENLRAISSQAKAYHREHNALPPVATWNTAIASYSELNATDLLTNRRNNNRVYILEPITPPATSARRALILSSMRAGLALPTAASINTSFRFQTLWDTSETALPSTASWTGWSTWASTDNSRDYLVIERINIIGDSITYPFALNNTVSGAGPSCRAVITPVPPAGSSPSPLPPITLGPGQSTNSDINPALNLRPGDRLDLYTASGVTPLYTYIVSTNGRSFDFDGTAWRAN